ncbi:MAG: BON domain-containing protein [Burkholderiaceae bacterium]|jgi:hyperosmotically inducible protein|nr:BON domain-containing protein [Burkholderiaceae bacterium]
MHIPGYVRRVFLILIVTALTACAAGQKHGTVGQYVEDSLVTTNVKAAVFKERTLSAAEISVETYNGIVQLSGFVSQPEQIAKATQVAQQVEGVREVKNNLMLKR